MESLDPTKYLGDFWAIVVSYYVIRWVRRFLETPTRIPDWDQWLKYVWLAGIPLVLADQFLGRTMTWFWAFICLAIVYTVWLIKDYRPARTLLSAIAPLAAVYVLTNAVRTVGFYAANKDYFEAAKGFAFIWLLTFVISARNQKKAISKQEEERSLVEARKAELEALVAERTAEIRSQKEVLQEALDELKTTQTQLIQSEKMASLGELTAGIAHEIQNPLNFVNNFSEVSVELIDELSQEQQKPVRDPELEAELLTDLRQNLQKITHHGHRAASIVRGMLQHSRTSTGQREPVDLNDLCDEYLRLAYHGLRAKDKSFNASFSTDLDTNLGLITAVPQDIGRVLLNLITNAFYAVQQRQKAAAVPTDKLAGTNSPPRADTRVGEGIYQPNVSVKTRCVDGQAQVTITDNGTGIPEELKARIFQPFFTTKPTGEGTGLGLSLAYDIVTKGHGGTLTVESKEGQGTTFVITLPA
ncbi:MAG: histidine kinase [Spirosoma sp.]|nr:histidine kinase [Spirosoma sp.]